MESKIIFDYFDDNIEYPKTIASDILPYGTLWEYVSFTLLNAFINHVDIIAGFVVDRYTKRDGKAELIESSIKKEKHANLRIFNDDVIVLGRIYSNKYMFFYFDYDVSDCMIGRFETDDDTEVIVQSIVNWLEECKVRNTGYTMTEHTESGRIDYMQLPYEFFIGWLSY